MTKRIFISAYNINTGGGKNLLVSLLKSIPIDKEVFLYADSRLKSENLKSLTNIKIKYVERSFVSRFLAELKIFSDSRRVDTVLCFGNLPPLFNTKAQVINYLHSRYLLDDKMKFNLSFKKRIFNFIEKVWLSTRLKKSHLTYVQTPTMLNLFKEKFGDNFAVREAAFLDLIRNELCEKTNEKTESFIYVASFDDHKNHVNLIKGWKILNKNGYAPPLKIVAPTKPPRSLVAEALGSNIEFVENLNREHLLRLYKESRCLIHPSYFESFGIVLVEAQQLGLDIIAPELDYVRDLVEPKETFDPDSPTSIARSVQRYLNKGYEKVKILTPEEFWSRL